MRSFLVGLILTLAFALNASAQQPRLWKDAPDQAKVLTATFLGGKGHDWLVSGGFAPDGTIVLAGNVAGPIFEMSVPIKVLGTDRPAPSEVKPIPILVKGEPKTDKSGKPLFEKPSWRHDGVTGFLVRTSGDLQKILSVHRLPWTSATITSALVTKDGAIFIAGRATDHIHKLGGDVAEWKASDGDFNKNTGSCHHTFSARLTSDAGKVVWLRHSTGPANAPQLALLADGNLRLSDQEIRTISPDGKLLKSVTVPGGPRRTASVSPTDGTIVLGGEHHWPTGREPWRCPTLNLHHSDGKLKYQLFDWGGPYVGLDNSRLVSDTAIRLVAHEPDGSILVMAWSDGGNSVMTQQPNDVRTGHGFKGLGITSAGAGVLSCAYVSRIDPKDCRFTAWTIWLAFSGVNKPNSIWIDTMVPAVDRSVCIAGRSAEMLVQTRNKLAANANSGSYIAVLSQDLTRARFCSAIPGAGAVEIDEGSTQNKNGWGIISGYVNGKPRVLCVTGVAPDKDTPTLNATQDRFAGGWTDGYAVLLDLATDGIELPKPAVPTPIEPGPTRASFEKGAAVGKKKDAGFPAEGATFYFKPDSFKYVTVDAELRDRGGKYWPSIFWGKPAEGTVTWRKDAPQCKLTVELTNASQPNGDQSRRVLGELIKGKDALPKLQLSLDSLGPAKTAQIKTTEKGKEVVRVVDYHDGKGTLVLADKKIAVAPKLTIGFNRNKAGELQAVRVTAWLTLPARELGLSIDGDIDLRVSMKGSASPDPEPKKKK